MIFAGLTKNSTAYSPIAQLVEQRTVNPWVTRSNRVEEASFSSNSSVGRAAVL